LHDVIHGRDAHDQIENRCQEHERLEQEQREERDYDYYCPYYDQPHRQHPPKGGRNVGGVKAFSHDFKPSGIEKYDGSTNPAKWLEVY
jgi:hypothetical protein